MDKLTVGVNQAGFVLIHEYDEGSMFVSDSGYCPFNYFVGKDCKYRNEVLNDMLNYTDMSKPSEVFISEGALEKIDAICEAARILF